MASKAIYILPTAVALAGAGYVGWQWLRPPPVVIRPPPEVSTFDEFQQHLAARAKAMGADADFQVVVTQAEAPIGAIMRKSSSVIKNDKACLPAEQPAQYRVPSLFPTTAFSLATVAEAGLGREALAGLGTAGIRLDQNGTVDFSVSDAGMVQLTDDDITALTDQPKCRAALPPGIPVWLVRGYIAGRRSFLLDLGSHRTGTVRFGRVGSIDIEPGSTTSSIAVKDAEPSRFLQVISEITLPKGNATAERTNAVAAPVAIGTPVALASAGRIYFQQDRRDTSRTASTIQAALVAAHYTLAPGVDLIDERKMPSSPQVRYFRPGDLARAQAVAGIVARTVGPTREVRVYLPSPPGQLEVWLPISAPQAPTAIRPPNRQ